MIGFTLALMSALVGQPPAGQTQGGTASEPTAQAERPLSQTEEDWGFDLRQTAASAPVERSSDRAQLDVCLYTPVERRDPACEPLLLEEASLVPGEAFSSPAASALTWADVACTPERLTAGQTRTDCRAEQRSLFRRADLARQALSAGVAGGVMADSAGYTVGPATSDDPGSGLALGETRRSLSYNCEQRSRVTGDRDTGSATSSSSVSCSWGTGDPEERERLRRMALGEDR